MPISDLDEYGEAIRILLCNHFSYLQIMLASVSTKISKNPLNICIGCQVFHLGLELKKNIKKKKLLTLSNFFL
jgi:hypothetical protein